MKRMILIMTLLIGTINADLSDNLKKQCQYWIYGNGIQDLPTGTYMYGIVVGQLYIVPASDETAFAKDARDSQIAERACKEALNNNSVDTFADKYKWGIAVTISKEAMPYRTLK